MLSAARQLVAASLCRGSVLRVAFPFVAEPAQPSVGVWGGEVRQAVGAHAPRELPHRLDEGLVSGGFMLAAGSQATALLQRTLERRVGCLLVGGTTKLSAGVGVREVGHSVRPDALRIDERALPRVACRRLAGVR